VVWLVFLVTALAVVLAATVLARNADVIADRTGLGHIWIGVFLLAAATSLPELVTGVAAVRIGAIDLAGGNIFGSNMANMALLGLLGLVYARRRVIQREALGIALTASVAIIMTGIASLFIIARLEVDLRWLSIGSLALVTVAVSSAFLMRRQREREAAAHPDVTPMAAVPRAEEPSLAVAAGWFTAAALVVVAAGIFLVDSAEEIAEITGVSDTFFGVLALALATSLPELSTCLDVVYVEGPLLESINVSNAVAGVVAMLLMTVGVMEMILRTERRRLPFDPAAAMILAGYVLGLLLVWSMPPS
jgi:cation:H+ antiporter